MKNNQIPEVRFPEFKDDWKQRNISSLINEIRRPIKIENNKKYKLVTVKRRNGGIVSRGIFRGEDILVKKYFELKQGDYLISKRQVVHGANGFVPESLDGAVVSNEYLVSAENKNITTDFLTIISRLPQMYKMFFLSSYGIDIEKLVFNVEDWKKRTISIPSVDEQKKIANLFLKFDKTITLHQQELAALKQTKQGFLQKMFPKEGEKVPEVRFPGFNDAWELRKLAEIGKTQSGIGFPDTEQGCTEGIPFYKVSDMNNTGNEHEMTNANNYVSDEQIQRKNWKPIETVPAVMFAKVGAAIMLNRKRLVREPFLTDNNTMAYIFDESWDTNFGKTLFETINLSRYAQVGALPSYNGSDIERIKVSVPKKEEQTKIGIFFMTLDNTITLHQRELEILKNTKKAFLQKMFV